MTDQATIDSMRRWRDALDRIIGEATELRYALNARAQTIEDAARTSKPADR